MIRNLIFCLAALAAAGGCGSKTREPAEATTAVAAAWEDDPNIALVVNPSWSSNIGRDSFAPLGREVCKRLSPNSRIALRRDGVPPEPGLSNLKPSEAKRALDGFVKGTVETGSDPKKAMEEAKQWLLASENAAHRRLILLAHDDMRADKTGAGNPTHVDWTGAKNIDVIITGVAPEMKDPLEKAWAGKVRSLRILTTEDRIQVKDILTRLPIPAEQFGF